MDTHPVPESCLQDEVLWELAFRFAGGDDEAVIASEGGPPDVFPGDFFLENEDDMKDHLHRCDICRDRLRRKILYAREYTKRMNDPDVRAIAKIIIEGIFPREESRILRFCPYDEDDDAKHHALAARTEPPHKEQPLRFMSEDEELMLRSFRDKKTGADIYYLAGNDPRFVLNVTVVFNGKRYRSDAEGRVDFGEDAQHIDEESEFIIIRCTQGTPR